MGIPNTVILQRCGQVSYAFDPACEEVVRGLCLGDPTEESGSSGSGVEETATTHPPVAMSCEACAHEILNTGNCGAFDGMEYSIILWTCGEGFRSDDGCDEVVRGICLGDPTEESGSSGSGEEETATTHPPMEMSCEACAHEILNTGNCGAFDGMEYSIILWTCGEGFRSDDGCDEVVRGICLGDPTEESGSSGSGEEE